MTVRNGSRGKLHVSIDPKSNQPPYDLSWLSYKVLSDGAVDWRHGPGGHGPMPPSTLSIGPGESVEVVGSLYGLKPEDYARRFKIQFKDEAHNSLVSGAFNA